IQPMTARRFTGEPLSTIILHVDEALARGEAVEVIVADPDHGAGMYAGERLGDAIHRPWRVWTELADRLGARLGTPRIADGEVVIRFEPLALDRVLDRGGGNEAYGAGSGFARIHKLEDPCFVLDLGEALVRCKLPAAPRVLAVGCNTGDELAVIYASAPDARVTGLDHSESALAEARTRYPAATFVVADVAAPLACGRFDLVLAIGMLQSGALDDRALLRRLVQDHLEPTGAVILGIPNCRYLDGELVFGARMRNFSQPELGLVIKDIAFFRKYLQQHHRQVFVTGRNYLFVTGVPEPVLP
ncbi:MAG: class I SAM-dependent methyltransferase, partial [Kofleriaceae bacterium]